MQERLFNKKSPLFALGPLATDLYIDFSCYFAYFMVDGLSIEHSRG